MLKSSHVFGPTTPSAFKPLAFWNSFIALFVLLATAGCATRGPRPLVIYPPDPGQAEHPVAGDPAELKLVTFNVCGLPSWLYRASAQRFTRIAKELEALHPDFAVFQEVWTRRALRAVPTADDWWVARASRSQWVFRRNGLVTLSRHPIIGGEFHPFRSARLPDSLVAKGALKTTIEVTPGVRINLWNVHLQSGDAEEIRCRQVAELAAWVREAQDGQVADLVAGDFNCGPGSKPYRQLVDDIGPGELEISHQAPLITYHGADPDRSGARALDHLFTRLREPTQTIQARPEVAFTAGHPQDCLSDHYGVLVHLDLAPASGVNPALRIESVTARARASGVMLSGLTVPAAEIGDADLRSGRD